MIRTYLVGRFRYGYPRPHTGVRAVREGSSLDHLPATMYPMVRIDAPTMREAVCIFRRQHDTYRLTRSNTRAKVNA